MDINSTLKYWTTRAKKHHITHSHSNGSNEHKVSFSVLFTRECSSEWFERNEIRVCVFVCERVAIRDSTKYPKVKSKIEIKWRLFRPFLLDLSYWMCFWWVLSHRIQSLSRCHRYYLSCKVTLLCRRSVQNFSKYTHTHFQQCARSFRQRCTHAYCVPLSSTHHHKIVLFHNVYFGQCADVIES